MPYTNGRGGGGGGGGGGRGTLAMYGLTQVVLNKHSSSLKVIVLKGSFFEDYSA